MALSTRIAVMDKGKVIQMGPPADIYEFPKSRFVADFIGTTNLFEGTIASIEAGVIHIDSAEAGGILTVDDLGRFSVGQHVWVALRPEKIALSKEPSPAGHANQLMGEVHELGYLGNHSTYRIKTATGKLVTVTAQNARRTAEWSIDWGDRICLTWPADAAILLES